MSQSSDHTLRLLAVNDQKNSSYAKVTAKEIENLDVDVRKSSVMKSLKKSKIYLQYANRWVILFCFLLSILVNGIAYETCIPNANQFIKIYEVNASLVTATATVYMLMHPLFTFLASTVIVKYGFATSVKIGILLTIFGYAVRLLVNSVSFWFVIVGSVFTGIGRPFILNAQATMTQNWFFPKSRTAVLTLCNMIQTISIVLSLMIPTTLVFNKYTFAADGMEKGKTLTFDLMLYELVISAILVPCLFLLKSNPPSPPSGFANTDVNIPFKDSMVKLFTNKNFILIFAPFSLYFGTFKGFGLIVPYLLSPWEVYTDQTNSNTGSMTILGGFISSLFISHIVLKVKSYKIIITGLMTLSLPCVFLLIFAVRSEVASFVYLDAAIMGFFLVPMVPVMLEYSCEAIYPLNGSFAVGLLLSGATLLTVVSTQILTLIVKGDDSDDTTVAITIIVIGVILVVGLIIFFFTKEIQNRTKEVMERTKSKASVFFKTDKLKQSVMNEDYKTQHQLRQGLGDFPTEHPYLDPMQFVQNPEVFDPDVISELRDDDHINNKE